MELCLITPPLFVEFTGLLSGRFCIAPVARDNTKYFEYFKKAADDGYNVILDNGAWEGSLVTGAELTSLADAMNAKVIITPDIVGGDSKESYQLSRDFAADCGPLFELMVVPQCRPGENGEFWKVVKQAIENPQFEWIGIGRQPVINAFSQFTMTDDQELNRFYFACEMHKRGFVHLAKRAGKKFHFLGVGDKIHYLQYYYWVESIDTASLFHQATFSNQVTLEGLLPTDVSRPKDYFTRIYQNPTFWEKTLRWNCHEVMKWVQKANNLKKRLKNAIPKGG